MTNKMTNKKALTIAIETLKQNGAEPGLSTILMDGQGYDAAEVVAKLEAMVTALDNKANSTKRKPTAKQTENEGLREKIVEFFTDYGGDPLTCTEIGKAIPELDGMNNQRISALMRALTEGEDSPIIKTTVKGKSVFSLRYEAEEEDGE